MNDQAYHSKDPAIPAIHPGDPVVARVSLQAVASLLLGLLGLFTVLLLFIGLLPAMGALTLGHLALIRIRHSKGRLTGRLAAVIGLTAGYLTVFLTPVIAIAVVVGFPHLDEYHRQGQETARLDHASALYRSCEDYARDHRGEYPATWDDLRGRYVNARELDLLLAGHHDSRWNQLKSLVLERESLTGIDGPAFVLVPHERPVLRELEGSVVVIREVAPPSVERIVIAYDNGETAMIANPDRE